MPGYKRYLYSSERIPRSTRYRIRRRAVIDRDRSRQLAAQTPLTQPSQSSAPVILDDNSVPVILDDEAINEQPAEASPNFIPPSDGHMDYQDEDVEETCTEHEGTQSKKEHGFSDGVRLCPCTSVTDNDLVLMCLALCMRHKWTWSALLDTFKMISKIFPKAETIPKSTFKLFQTLSLDKPDLIFQVFCPDCEKYLDRRDTMKSFETCNNCGMKISVSTSSNYFCSLPLQSQLKNLLEGPEDVGGTILKFRSNRQNLQANTLEDIFDGSEYKKHSMPGGILSSPQNFSFNFFTDGVPMGNSNKTIWPIYISINEVPYKLRGKLILLAGIYVGPKDPNLNVFLKPFVDDANKLSTEGVEWNNNGKKIVSKVITMCCVADSVARCKILNMQTFHAFWGCTFCYQVQERTSRRLKFTINVNQTISLRTKESTESDVVHAFEKKDESKEEDRHFRGVKGPSCLATLNYFDTSHGVVVDYMHCILLGVIKSHMELLLDPSMKKDCWILDSNESAMSDIISVVDSHLLSIRPPNSISRAPESLSKRKHWKASQWRCWLLYFCIICLKDTLKEKYLVHLAMLSKATGIILQKTITIEEVHEAHDLFLRYQYQFQSLFGKEYMFYNIHLLSHICGGILRFGPAWTHNSFMYEGKNRYILQLYKSPFSVAFQISKRYLAFQSFPSLCVSLASTELTFDFCEEVLDQQLKTFVRSSEALLLGKGTPCTLSQTEIQCLLQSSKTVQVPFKSYQRMLYGGFRVSENCHQLSTIRNVDWYLVIKGKNVVSVEKILNNSKNEIVIIGHKVSTDPEPLVTSTTVKLTHIQRCADSDELVCFEPKDISGQCIFMDLGPSNAKYVSSMHYGCYGD